MTEARLVKGHACDNCGEPMVAHCSRHVIPCCPHYPQHEPVAAPAEGLREALEGLLGQVDGIVNAYGDKGWAKSDFCRTLRQAAEPARAALARHESAGSE